jgi:hypothetical protein
MSTNLKTISLNKINIYESTYTPIKSSGGTLYNISGNSGLWWKKNENSSIDLTEKSIILQNGNILLPNNPYDKIHFEGTKIIINDNGNSVAYVSIDETAINHNNLINSGTTTHNNIDNYLLFLSGWKEYHSTINTLEIMYSATAEIIDIITASDEVTEITVPDNGTYKIIFFSQYTITSGECDCLISLNSIITSLNSLSFTTGSAEYANTTMSPLLKGNYDWAGATSHTGTLFLDAQGDVNAEFIIRSGGAHTVAANSSTILLNGARSCNVYWVISGAITIAATCTLIGTYISTGHAISAAGSFIFNGRLLTTAGAIATTTISATVPTDPSIYTDGTSLQDMLIYTGNGAISTTGYTNTSDPPYTWKIETEIGVVSGFTEPGVSGSYPSDFPPLINSKLFITVGGVPLQNLPFTLFENNIGVNYSISVSSVITINNINERRISIGCVMNTLFGGIIFGNRSLSASPLLILT